MLGEGPQKTDPNEKGGCFVDPALGNNTVAKESQVLLNTILLLLFLLNQIKALSKNRFQAFCL